MTFTYLRQLAVVLCSAWLLVACNSDQIDAAAAPARSAWVGSWATAPYGPYPDGPLTEVLPLLPGSVSLTVFPGNQARDQSFRMLVRTSLGGDAIRVRLSNLMGDRPLQIGALRVAHSVLLGPLIVPESDHVATVAGQRSFVIPAGEEIVSDPIEMAVAAGADLAISFHVVGESGPITWHAVSFTPNFVALPGTGDRTADISGLSFIQPTLGWFFVSGVDVLHPGNLGAVVALGDSITDGFLQTLNLRWTDRLAERLQQAGIAMSVLNQGINSNSVTAVRSGPAGPPALERFDRDVLQRPGVRTVIIFEGTNDLTAGGDAESVIDGLQQLVNRARRAGLCVIGATLMPRADVGFGWIPQNFIQKEPERQKINAWIREGGVFDAVLDFDALMGLPLAPTLPNPLLYIPDLLHPNPVGFRLMGDAIPLEILAPELGAKCGA